MRLVIEGTTIDQENKDLLKEQVLEKENDDRSSTLHKVF